MDLDRRSGTGSVGTPLAARIRQPFGHAEREPTSPRQARRPRLRTWLCLAPLLAAATASSPPPITIAAFLLSSETGRLSPDAITHPDLLGNAVAGAASAHAALVRVRVAGDHGAPVSSGARVRLVARIVGAKMSVGGAKAQAGRVLLDRTVRLGPAGTDGGAYAGFWLDDVGCAPVALDATLVSGPRPMRSHADLGFQCYE